MTGTKLKQTRERLRLRSNEVARLMGVRVETVWRWETGRVPVPENVEMAITDLENDPEKVREIKLNRNAVRQQAKQNRRLDAARQAESTPDVPHETLEPAVEQLVEAVMEVNGIPVGDADALADSAPLDGGKELRWPIQYSDPIPPLEGLPKMEPGIKETLEEAERQMREATGLSGGVLVSDLQVDPDELNRVRERPGDNMPNRDVIQYSPPGDPDTFPEGFSPEAQTEGLADEAPDDTPVDPEGLI